MKLFHSAAKNLIIVGKFSAELSFVKHLYLAFFIQLICLSQTEIAHIHSIDKNHVATITISEQKDCKAKLHIGLSVSRDKME